MGEVVNKFSPEPKDGLKNVGLYQQDCDSLNNLSRLLRLDASGLNSTDSSITDSTSIDDKSSKKISKKKKKKGKKNPKCSEKVTEARSSKCGQNLGITSCQSSVKGIGNLNVDGGASIYNGTPVKCQKNCQTVPPTGTTTLFTCVSSSDATNQVDRLISECICGGHIDFTGSHVLADVWNSSHDDTVSSGRVSNGTMQEAQGLNTAEKKIMMHCNNACTCINDLKDNQSCGDLFQNISCGIDSVTSSTFEDCDGASSDRTKSGSPCFINAHGDAVHPGKHDSMVPQGDIANKPRCHHNNVKTGKENTQSIRPKSRKCSRDAFNHGAKRLNHIYVRKDVKLQDERSQATYNSCSSNGLLPTPAISSTGHNAAALGTTNIKQKMCGRTHCSLFVESSRWVAQQRCHSGFNQIRQDDSVVVTRDWGNLKEKRNFSYEHENFSTNKKGVGGYKEHMFRIRNRMILSQTEALKVSGELHCYNNRPLSQRSIKNDQFTETDESNGLHSYPTSAHVRLNVPQTTMSGVTDCTLLPGIRRCMSMKIPRTEHVLAGSLHASSDKVQRNPPCLDIKHSYLYNIRQESNSRVSSQKWIPVGRKGSDMLTSIRTGYATNGVNDTPKACSRKADMCLEENIIPASVASVDTGKTCLMLSHDIIPAEMSIKSERAELEKICKNLEDNNRHESVRDFLAPDNKANTPPRLVIGSQMAVKALNVSYRLQIASENVQLATGNPLAEFEKLLQSATPAIAPASVLQHCTSCLGNQLPYSLLCKRQTANIPLHDVWSWYEKPGNYGLEVKAEESRNLKWWDSNSVSFNAHFVPFLSAIQLFAHPQDLSCNNRKGHFIAKIPEKGQGEPDDVELVFEFFEYEQPQQRKPLYDKVTELVKDGTSNHRIFGDPSWLECTNLQNLHPASWYAVAWYPIYRIPEGNFRASFLTYHSLGHLTQRFSTDFFMKNQSCVVSPVLGLQSYNAQGEGWFYPKMSSESSSKGSMPLNSSEILKERLRTLEETALLFARGCVFKDHVKVTNRQPDYEFFLSRKH